MKKIFELFSAAGDRDRRGFQYWFRDSFGPSVLEVHPGALGYAVTLIDVMPKPLISMRQDMAVPPPPFCDVVTEMWLPQHGLAPTADLPSSHPRLLPLLQQQGTLAAAYRITEQRRFDRHPQSPLGTATRGLKFYAFMQWRDGLSPADGRRMWTEHLEIVNRIHVRMSKYIQNWVEATIKPGPHPCDGIAQIYYETLSDFEQYHYGTIENRDAVRADTARFNRGSMPLFGTEYVLKRAQPA